MYVCMCVYGPTRSYALVLCILNMFTVRSRTTIYIATDMTSKGFDSSMSLGRSLPERLRILSVSRFTLGFVGSRTAGQTAMGRVVSGDVARAVTAGCRALELLWMGLYLRAICTWTTRQTANIANSTGQLQSGGQTTDIWPLFAGPIMYHTSSRLSRIPWRATPP